VSKALAAAGFNKPSRVQVGTVQDSNASKVQATHCLAHDDKLLQAQHYKATKRWK
jgi:hypothetical protein